MTKKKTMLGFTGLGLLVGVSGIVHAQNLVTNGGFETTTLGPNGGQIDNGNVSDWVPGDGSSYNSGGYSWLYNPTTATTPASPKPLYGPIIASPNGGNFIGQDSAYSPGNGYGTNVIPISQTIGGLTVGDIYTVSFNWAGAQQQGFSGTTFDQWQVSLGGQTQATAFVDNASEGFTGWMSQSFTYTATSTSEVLSFLAVGGDGTFEHPTTPPFNAGNSQPPFALLDGVSLTASVTPESASLVSMFAGLMGIGVFTRIRARAKKSVA